MDEYRERKRERRIRDRWRMVAKGRRFFLESNYWTRQPQFRLHAAEMHGRKFHDYLKICSCDTCGNQRHNRWNAGKDRLTMQERRALIDEKEQLNWRLEDG